MKKNFFGIFLVFLLTFLIVVAIHTLPKSDDGTNEGVMKKGEIPGLIVVDEPLFGEAISSPLRVSGQARGTWFFEASFPVFLYDGNNQQIAVTHAEAQSDWMTEKFVPFLSTVKFSKPSTPMGTLVLKNDNPSGDPARDMELRIPVFFE